MDWQQVVLNGGPPCFHLCDDGRFCGRAAAWDGHEDIHDFVSLHSLLTATFAAGAKFPIAPKAGEAPPHLRMSGKDARLMITNSHALLRRKFAKSPLWSLVGSITGHGSGYSYEICVTANLDPMQPCSNKELKDFIKQ